MKYRQLGNSGLIVSELCLGTMTFGEGDYYGFKFTIDQSKANDLVSQALEKGINFFDSADMYGNGQCELILGKAIGSKRHKTIIATKTCFRASENAFDAGINSKHLIQQCNQSLKNLNTDYLDVLLLHNDDPITPIDETLRTLENLVQQGKVRYVGFSNFQAWKASAMLQRQKDLNYSPFVASQMHYSILNREVEAEIIPMSQHHGVGMMVWSPLSGGFLTGKYSRENPAPNDARLNTFDLGLFDRELGYKVIDVLKVIAERHNTSIIAVSLSWLLSKKVVSSIIIGVSKLEQLDDNLQSVEVQLSAEELLAIDELTKPTTKYPATFIGLQDQILLSAKAK